MASWIHDKVTYFGRWMGLHLRTFSRLIFVIWEGIFSSEYSSQELGPHGFAVHLSAAFNFDQDSTDVRHGSAMLVFHKCLFSFTYNSEFHDVKDVENPSNLAYTTRELPLHTDLAYVKSPPDVSG